MINALTFFALLMILHYSLTILNINANALSLIFFINANTLVITRYLLKVIYFIKGKTYFTQYLGPSSKHQKYPFV